MDAARTETNIQRPSCRRHLVSQEDQGRKDIPGLQFPAATQKDSSPQAERRTGQERYSMCACGGHGRREV